MPGVISHVEVFSIQSISKEEITIEGSKKLFTRIRDYDDYTQIEKQTVAHIRKNYKFTPEANQWLRREIREWTASKTRGKKCIL